MRRFLSVGQSGDMAEDGPCCLGDDALLSPDPQAEGDLASPWHEGLVSVESLFIFLDPVKHENLL